MNNRIYVADQDAQAEVLGEDTRKQGKEKEKTRGKKGEKGDTVI